VYESKQNIADQNSRSIISL